MQVCAYVCKGIYASVHVFMSVSVRECVCVCLSACVLRHFRKQNTEYIGKTITLCHNYDIALKDYEEENQF